MDTTYEHILERFNQNLELAKEDYPEDDFEKQVKIAKGWTEDDVRAHVERAADNRIAQNQNAVNKLHFG